MNRIFGKLLLAISYVTALPVAAESPEDQELDFSGLSPYLPVVGLLIGAILAGAWLLLASSNELLRAIVTLVIGTLVTGAFHLDGLMDSADGIFSCRNRERMLAIMHDSRVGNFGAIAGILSIVCRFATLVVLPATTAVACALLLIPAWSRAAEVCTIRIFPYAREEGMGKVWHETTSKKHMIVALLIPATATTAAWLGSGQPFLALTAVATIGSGLCAAVYINGKLQGHTGDTYGAVVELAECGGLLFLASWLAC